MKHTSHTLAIRAWELRKKGLTEEQVGQQLADELAREAIGYTPAEVREAVTEADEIYAAHIFVQRHPEWRELATDTNIDLLQQRAREYNDGAAFDLGALEAAYYDLIEESVFETPEPEPAPATEPEPAPATAKPQRGIQRPPASGTLTVDPAVRAELDKLPLKELRKRANADRWKNIGRDRALRLKAGFTAV